MNLALKIDVDTYRGTRDGVPRLVELLKKYDAGATFLFSLGPDHTGRAIKRVFRPGFLSKVRRTSVVSHYGIRTLLYGTVLPGPGHRPALRRHDAHRARRGLRGRASIPRITSAGRITSASRMRAWTRHEMERACDRFRDIFGGERTRPRRRRLADESPCLPPDAAARLRLLLGHARHPSFRSGLPGEDRRLPAIADHAADAGRADRHRRHRPATTSRSICSSSAATCRRPVMSITLHAELEGMKLAPVFERLLQGLARPGLRLVASATTSTRCPTRTCRATKSSPADVPGRSGTLALQGPRVSGVNASDNN